jgi:hypothetical protein
MNKKIIIPILIFFTFALNVFASPIRTEGQKIAAYLTIIAIMVSLPAFVSLYLHIRKTNLGNVLFQPFLAMFIGFFGIMLNSILDVYRVFQGFTVDNYSIVMGVNRAISSVLIAAGCVVMFFGMRNRGLFSYSYYNKHKNEEVELIPPVTLKRRSITKKKNSKSKVNTNIKRRQIVKAAPKAPKLKTKAKSRTKVKPKATPWSKVKSKPKAKPRPKPKAKSKAKVKPKSKVKAKPRPKPKRKSSPKKKAKKKSR